MTYVSRTFCFNEPWHDKGSSIMALYMKQSLGDIQVSRYDDNWSFYGIITQKYIHFIK